MPVAADPPDGNELLRLIDKDAIRDLVLRYSRAVDRQDFALLRTLYAEDAIEDNHGGLYAGTAVGYVNWLMEVMPRLNVTAHYVHNHLIDFECDTRAQGEVYATAYHRLPAADGGWDDLVHGMRYLDHYRKERETWRFARRTVAVDWKQVRPCGWDPLHAALNGSAFGTNGADDPSYRVLDDSVFLRRTG